MRRWLANITTGSETMGQDDVESIADAIADRLREMHADLAGMSAKEHRDHHDALQRFIDRETRRAELYERIKASTGGWVVITTIAGIGYAVWEWLRTHLR